MTHQRQGLTFLEVLLSVAMLGLLMVGASTLLFAMARTYFTMESFPQFEHHADGATALLYNLAFFSTTGEDAPGAHFEWKASPASRQPTLAWNIDRETPFFVSEEALLPPLTAYLEFDDENGQFWLVWHVDPRLTGGKPELRYSLLSEWAGDIEYGYYDENQKQWEFELASSASRQNAKQRPERLTLIFERNGERLRRAIDFNPLDQHVLTY